MLHVQGTYRLRKATVAVGPWWC